jgi:hypothetical protein
MRLRFQGAAGLVLLPDPAHGGHTETAERRNLVGAFALLMEVDDPFADRRRNRSHGPVWPDLSAFESYIIYRNALVLLPQATALAEISGQPA